MSTKTEMVQVEINEKSTRRDDIIKVRCLTWNVGNTKPNFDELSHTLNLEELADFDVVVVGTQENSYGGQTLKDGHTSSKLDVLSLKSRASAHQMAEVPGTIGENVDPGTEEDEGKMVELRQATTINNEWEAEICKHMGDDWSILERVAFGEMKLFVLLHTGQDSSSVWASRNVAVGVEKATSATGIGGILNNKGGIVISFHIRNTYLSFVTAHLNAHMEHEAKRNSDHREIRRETQQIGNNELDVCTDVDHCVWIGDLNYRVDLNRSEKSSAAATKKHKDKNWATVKQMIDQEEYSQILEHDQLNNSKKEGLAWNKFKEGDINFKPTFKVKKKMTTTDYKDQRVPAYCDRVLWKSAPHLLNNVECMDYRGCTNVSTSDHKPVIADLEIQKSHPPSSVYSFMAGGRRKKHRDSSAGVSSNDVDYFDKKRNEVWPVVEITNLRATNITASDIDLRGRTSDPYVEFHSNPIDLLWHHPHKVHKNTGKTFPPVTKVLSNTLNPTWSNNEIPMLRPQISTQKALDHCSLIMLLKDSDLTSVDDPLGTVSVRFPGYDRNTEDNATSNQRYTFDFDEAIDLNGCIVNTGRLMGTITVSWENDMRNKAREAFESEYSDGCGCCTNTCQGGCQCVLQ